MAQGTEGGCGRAAGRWTGAILTRVAVAVMRETVVVVAAVAAVAEAIAIAQLVATETAGKRLMVRQGVGQKGGEQRVVAKG